MSYVNKRPFVNQWSILVLYGEQMRRPDQSCYSSFYKYGEIYD